jgi:uncharacterized protein YecE (DUF72 family)
MEFGRIPVNELDTIKFALPPEPADNNKVLPGVPNPNGCKFYLGMPRWGGVQWVNKIYPARVKEKEFLEHYIKHFNSVELNATHYKIYREEEIKNWTHRTAGKEFKFCPKHYKGVTHFGNLKGKQAVQQEYLDGIRSFGTQLGAIFIQLSDSFAPIRIKELIDYLDTLPSDLPFFLELRHALWFANNDIFRELTERNLGAVITDTAGRRDCVHMNLTVPKIFVRFVGNDLHDTDYGRINQWATRINGWQEKGLQEVYFFIHSKGERESLDLAKYAIDQLNQICNANLKPLKFIETKTLF